MTTPIFEGFQWGGLIEKYLTLRAESPETADDPQMEYVMNRLDELEKTKDFGIFIENFTAFSLKELSRLNSPILDALYFDYYGIPIPDPSLPEEKLPNQLELLRQGKVANSFKELLVREVKVLSVCQYLWERLDHQSILEMQQLACQICLSGTPEVFTFYLEQQVFASVDTYHRGRGFSEKWLCRLVEARNLPLLAIIPDKLATDRAEALSKAGRIGEVDNYQVMDALFNKYPELSEEKALYEFLLNMTYQDRPNSGLFVKILNKLQLPLGATSEELNKVLIQLAQRNQVRLLQLMGARNHIPDDLRNRLLSVGSGQVETISYLLAIGARLSEASEILTFSMRSGGRAPEVKLLLEHGANPEVNEHSALRAAALLPRGEGRAVVVNLLIEWYRAHPQGYNAP